MIETKAQQYKRIKATRAAKQETFDVEMPSGLTWTLRKPDIQQFVINGTMPMSMASKLSKAAQDADGDNLKAFSTLSIEDQIKTIGFSQKVVRFCAVDPRIVETPTADNEIGYDDVEIDDFNAILAWALPGGGEAESLDSFPSK